LNQDGFASFFHQRYSSTVVLLITMGASRADAEEIAQEAMIAAWQKWESIREPVAWVRTAAVRKLWKHRQRQPELPLEENAVHVPTSQSDLAVFTEEQQWVVRLLRQLPDAQRTVAALHYDGLNTEEIAAVTGKPANTVRSHLRHARATLKEVIASDRPTHAAPEP
jgi:RNA polymerase sigma factor (sigma-70 family)